MEKGVADIFGQGTDLDDSEAVQTARKAKELLDRLAEYKPLAKIEENAINGMEEQNYNMIDNVLNNEAEKKSSSLMVEFPLGKNWQRKSCDRKAG